MTPEVRQARIAELLALAMARPTVTPAPRGPAMQVHRGLNEKLIESLMASNTHLNAWKKPRTKRQSFRVSNSSSRDPLAS